MFSFFQNFSNYTWWDLLLIPAVLLTLIIHELCHGLAAYGLGDPTAKRMGRLSLNPVRHLDPIGALMLLVVGFGWAKPVRVDSRYFEKPKRDMALVALAGPVSNFLLSILAIGGIRLLTLFSGVAKELYVLVYFPDAVGIPVAILGRFLLYLATISAGLGLFNLIPIPPLDGSKVLGAFLPDRYYWKLMQYERFGMIILIVLIMFGSISDSLAQVRDVLLNVFFSIFGLSN